MSGEAEQHTVFMSGDKQRFVRAYSSSPLMQIGLVKLFEYRLGKIFFSCGTAARDKVV